MLSNENAPLKIGIIGTGCIARGLANLLVHRKDMQVAGMLSRRLGYIPDVLIPQDKITRIPEKLMEVADIIVVSTGDPIYSTEMINLAFTYNLPVVTMDADTQVLSGHWLSQRGFITESEGDQPGCLAALNEEALFMGFEPIVYGNIKGFLNQNPTLKEMEFWAEKQGFSVNSVTSFTDGTKLQIEQALVANGIGGEIARKGLIGPHVNDLEKGAFELAKEATRLNATISDYIVSPESPPGVFIVCTHKKEMAKGLQTYKMGAGPYYLLYKPVHLCYFEIPKTIHRAYYTRNVLLDNGSAPKHSVAAVVKNKISSGTFISKGIGSMEVRGEAIRIEDYPNHVPIGLLDKVLVKRNIEPGEVLTFDDVDMQDSLALQAWLSTITENIAAE